MKVNGEVYRFIEANRSLDKICSQDNEYPIRSAYKLIKAKKELDDAIEYVMQRFSNVCGEAVDFENLNNEQNVILNSILSQEIEIELPELTIEEVTDNNKVRVTSSDMENLLFVFENRK